MFRASIQWTLRNARMVPPKRKEHWACLLRESNVDTRNWPTKNRLVTNGNQLVAFRNMIRTHFIAMEAFGLFAIQRAVYEKARQARKVSVLPRI
jgi:hypothetical protein